MAHDQYCDKDDLKAYVGLTGSGQDNNIDNAINAASREIDQLCKRVFFETETTEDKYFNPTEALRIVVPDISKTTSLVVKLDTTDDGTHDTTLVKDTDFYLNPINPPQIATASGTIYYEPYNELQILSTRSSERFDPTIPKNIKITAFWGFSRVPDAIKQACLLQATRLWKRKDSPFSTYGNPATGTGELFNRFDPDALKLIKGYAKKTL